MTKNQSLAKAMATILLQLAAANEAQRNEILETAKHFLLISGSPAVAGAVELRADAVELVDRLRNDHLISWFKPLLAILAPRLLADYRYEGIAPGVNHPPIYTYLNLRTFERLNVSFGGECWQWTDAEKGFTRLISPII